MKIFQIAAVPLITLAAKPSARMIQECGPAIARTASSFKLNEGLRSSNFPSLVPSKRAEGRAPVRVPGRARVRNRGFTIIECLVYIGTVAVVLGIGSAALYRCWDDNVAISRNADDVVRTLKAGEAWRADVRSATGPIKATTNGSRQIVVIPHGTNELTYSFSAGEVRKQYSKSASWIVVLPKVKSSQMESDPRDRVAAWRWELALESRRKNAKLHPLFTFEAVAGNSFVQ